MGFTGRSRRRTTKWTVLLWDKVARLAIATGGIGTIIAVVAVFCFLVSVVAPLFFSTKVGPLNRQSIAWAHGPVAALACDEYKTLGWVVYADNRLVVYRLDTGDILVEKPLIDSEPALTALTVLADNEHFALGFADGSVRLGQIKIQTESVPTATVTAGMQKLAQGESLTQVTALVTRSAAEQWRRTQVIVELEEPVKPASDSPVVLIDRAQRSSGPMFAAFSADGKLRFNAIYKRVNQITEEVTLTVKGGTVEVAPSQRGTPKHLLLNDLGDIAYLIWQDGFCQRYDLRDLKTPVVAEEIDLVTDPQATLTTVRFAAGRTTLLTGDSQGNVRAWFPIRPDPDGDKFILANAHTFGGPAAVSALAVNPALRLVACGYADGSVRLYYITSERLLAQLDHVSDGPIAGLLTAPRGDGLVALTGSGLARWNVDLSHPEATIGTLFTKVWYEGYHEPSHTWQTSSGTETTEPKYGLIPLIFGTLKATFYAMLFAVPIALLAAIYTSEFLHPKTKARVKPAVELMASLPSVVLGYLAVTVVAETISASVISVISGVFTLPLAFMSGAYLWQLLPRRFAVRHAKFKFFGIIAMLPVGAFLATLVGGVLEQWLFVGDFKAWLNNRERYGNGLGGWFVLMLPVSAVAVSWVWSAFVTPALRQVSVSWSHFQIALADLAKFLLGVAVTIGTALAIGWLLSAIIGVDPRGKYHVFDTYVDRNALVLGFVMGFAVIPIIYTVAEDALNSVPVHLRSASLGAGATTWQTAIRIVVPTAMSGLFSASMIGLGRAVGETMIVFMAAGNTPILEANLFNGFETLSAAIATELSDAAQGSTHYRILFLAALTLFVITFIVNSIAEIVRQRFRKRAYEL